ncbi:DegT/DnrJ/EryC1/StrS family aminotransferase [Sulfurimonas sp. HSL3-7]|uniref:DegT/DnrJ/EryC1/StrS family aminotransferase n=1 Tax=Sulfonitrofixus jiaomeiensis TaxID=3131938 RepID=UPI0031F75B0B
MVNVSKVYFPDKQKFLNYVEKVYESGWLTNNGPLVQELEKRLAKHLGVKNLLCVSNGTTALQLSYKLLQLKGEVITTPFSFVATTSSIKWEGLDPVFTDIDPETFNIDPVKMEKSLSVKTSAIVPVHVFGNACEIEEIDRIAKKNSLKVIYDASHAFDVKYKNESILNYGDISVISFHATKFFHTIEGAAIVVKDDDLYEKAKIVRNFGLDDQNTVKTLGINAKMNELEAAMGLCVLDEIDTILAQRKKSHDYYAAHLKDYVQLQRITKDASQSYSYFPIVLRSEEELENVRNALLAEAVSPRQYFYPSLDTLPYVKLRQVMRNSRDIAGRILVVPMHSGIEAAVSKIIIETLHKQRR